MSSASGLFAVAATAACLVLGYTSTAQAQVPIVADIAQPVVEIRTAFAGTNLLVFGAINCPLQNAGEAEGCAIAATIKGPPEAITVRRKTRKSGLWVNGAAANFGAAPGYYAFAATAPLADITSISQRQALELGPENLKLRTAGDTAEDANAFRKGLISTRSSEQLYLNAPQRVRVRDNTLFRMSFPIPANVPIGDYTVAIYTFLNMELIAQTEQTLRIEKAGFEAYVTQIAQRLSLLYGFASIVLAFAIGLAASYIFKT